MPILALGGRGVVSVVGNIVPRDVKAMINAFEQGKIEEAQRWHKWESDERPVLNLRRHTLR